MLFAKPDTLLVRETRRYSCTALDTAAGKGATTTTTAACVVNQFPAAHKTRSHAILGCDSDSNGAAASEGHRELWATYFVDVSFRVDVGDVGAAAVRTGTPGD